MGAIAEHVAGTLLPCDARVAPLSSTQQLGDPPTRQRFRPSRAALPECATATVKVRSEPTRAPMAGLLLAATGRPGAQEHRLASVKHRDAAVSIQVARVGRA